MTKSEFLDELKLALSGRVSAQEATEHLRFYEDYINTQMRMGKREEEILSELGEPRLLARNIAESKKYASDGSEKNHTGNNGDTRRGGNAYTGNNQVKGVKLPGWIWIILIVLILIIFFALCFSILSFLAPVLIPLALILLWIHFLQKKS